MRAGGCSYSSAANQLGIGLSAVKKAVEEVAKAASARCGDWIKLPRPEGEVAKKMNEFEEIRRKPHCVGAVGGARIRWLSCPDDQCREHRCCKGYLSIAIFAVAATGRRFICADIVMPGVMGGSSIFERSALK